MTHIIWYNVFTEAEDNPIKYWKTDPLQRRIKMTRELRQVIETVQLTDKVSGENVACKDCNCSVYTMASVAGSILLCIGIVAYGLICG
jgi:hypothetical protein